MSNFCDHSIHLWLEIAILFFADISRNINANLSQKPYWICTFLMLFKRHPEGFHFFFLIKFWKLNCPYLRQKCPYEAHFGLKRLQITSSFQKPRKNFFSDTFLWLMVVLVGPGIFGSLYFSRKCKTLYIVSHVASKLASK